MSSRLKLSSALPRNEALRPGARLGRYEVCKVLRRDRFGVTYQARDTRLECDVVISEYLPTDFAARLLDDSIVPRSPALADRYTCGRDRVLADAAAFRELGSTPGIASVLNCLEANGTAYVVTAAAQGDTVAALLARQGRLSPQVMERLVPSLLDTLERMHTRGLLHLDIKPSSILLNDQGHTALLDFGMAHIGIWSCGRATPPIRGLEYTAPERFTGEPIGPFTDIYGLAATLYRCTTGLVPLAAVSRLRNDNLAPASKIATGRYRAGLLDGIDAGLALRMAERPPLIVNWRRFFAADRGIALLPKQPLAVSLIDREVALPVASEDEAGRWAPPALQGRRTGVRRGGWAGASAIALLVTMVGAVVAGGALLGPGERRADSQQIRAEADRRAGEGTDRKDQPGTEATSARHREGHLRGTAEKLRLLDEEWARRDRELMARTVSRQQAQEEIRRATDALQWRAAVQTRLEAESEPKGQ